MNHFLKNLGCLLLLFCALGINTQTASAQATANCHGTAYVNLSPNGVGTITVNDINNGSVGTILGISSNTAIGGTISQVISVDCNDLGTMPVILTVADSTAGVTHVCTTNVTVWDTLGVCNTTSGLILTDSFSTDASSCNACDGEAYVYLQDPNNPFNLTAGTAPYTFTWSDGVTYTAAQYAYHYRNDLCAGTYTVTMYDGNQMSYTYSVQIGCGTTGGGTLNAVCNTMTLDLNPNGIATLDPQTFGAGSTGGYLQIIGGNPAAGTNSIMFDCNNLGANYVTLLVTDTTTGNVDTCGSYVYITDSGNNCGTTGCIDPSIIDTTRICSGAIQPVCGCDGVTYNNACEAEFWYGVTSWTNGACGSTGTGNTFFGDSLTMDASSCNTCDGLSVVGLMTNTSIGFSNANAPFVFTWSDGVTYTSANYAVHQRNDLCPNTVYTVTMYDNMQNSYTTTVQVGCTPSSTGGANAVCNPRTLDINANGVATLDAQTFGAGSTGNYFEILGANPIAGATSSITFDCSHLGANYVTLVVTDTVTGDVDTCSSYVYVTDSGNNCGTTGNGCNGLNMTLSIQQDTTNNYQLWSQIAISGATPNNSFTYTWDFGDGSAPVTGATPSHTYANFGTYLICVQATDATGCVLVACATITVDSSGNFSRNNGFTINANQPIVDMTSSVEPIVQNEVGITLFPNPTYGEATLAINATTNEEATINIIDLNGRILSSQQVNIATGTQTISLDLSRFSQGLYMVQYQSETNMQNFKLIKQ